MEIIEDEEKEKREEETGEEVADSPDSPDSPDPEEAPADSEAQEDSSEPEEEEEEEVDLEAENAELKDKLLRTMAESENVRRRAERDKESTAKYAIANFAREMLRVNDNLRRALESVDEETRKETETVENLAVGIEMTEREMLNAFERVGIKPIDALDQKFDPNLHEAMFEVEDKSRTAGTVVQVVETGYLIHDRPLRPSRVAVSKGGPKMESAAESAAAPPPESQTEGQTAYEKRVDAQGGTPGAQLDEEL